MKCAKRCLLEVKFRLTDSVYVKENFIRVGDVPYTEFLRRQLYSESLTRGVCIFGVNVSNNNKPVSRVLRLLPVM
jgi:hypothetical protein